MLRGIFRGYYQCYRGLLLSVLVLQLGLGPGLLSIAQANSGQVSESSQSRSAKEIDFSKADAFLLNQQVVKFFTSKGEFIEAEALDKPGAKFPEQSFSKLNVKLGNQGQSLIFEGIVANIVRTRHIIKNLDIVDFVRDAEMITLLHKDGRISMIDMGYALQNLFRSPVPVYQNISLVPGALSEEYKNSFPKSRISFLTRGIKPFKNFKEGLRLPLPEGMKKDHVFESGSAVVYDSAGKLLAYIPRSRLYKMAKEHSAVLSLMAFLKTPQDVPSEWLGKIEKFFSGKPRQKFLEDFSKKNGAKELAPLMNIRTEQIEQTFQAFRNSRK